MGQWCDLPNLSSPNPPPQGGFSLTSNYQTPPPPPPRRTEYVTQHVIRESAPRPSPASSSSWSPSYGAGSYGGAGSSSVGIKELSGRSGALWLICWYSIATIIGSLICVCGLGGGVLYLLGSYFGKVEALKIFTFTLYLTPIAAFYAYFSIWERSKVTGKDALDAAILLAKVAVGIVVTILIGRLTPIFFAPDAERTATTPPPTITASAPASSSTNRNAPKGQTKRGSAPVVSQIETDSNVVPGDRNAKPTIGVSARAKLAQEKVRETAEQKQGKTDNTNKVSESESGFPGFEWPEGLPEKNGKEKSEEKKKQRVLAEN